MKRIVLMIIPLTIIIGSCSWFRGDSSIPFEQIQGEFVSLFDGQSLDQWVIMGNPEGWHVVDGMIHSEGGKGGDWLRSQRQYQNFILTLEYRVAPGGNSGVFFRCPEEGQPWVTGYECQISNEQPPRDALHCTGSLYGLAPADPRPDESPEVWHSLRILCKNRRIMIFVDGNQTVDTNMDQNQAIKNKPLEGYIGLQDSHTGEGRWVEFRDIRIREL